MVAAIFLVGCSQETPKFHEDTEQSKETVAELKARAEIVFNARQAWIKENIWIENLEWRDTTEFFFTLWNRSGGSLKSVSVMVKYFDKEHRCLETVIEVLYLDQIPNSNVALLQPQNNAPHAVVLKPMCYCQMVYYTGDVSFPIKAIAHATFNIVGVSISGVTLPGD